MIIAIELYIKQIVTTKKRLLTGHGHTGHLLHKWHMKPTPACDCGAANQTAKHIANECPISETAWMVGTVRLASCDLIVTQWLSDMDLDI